MFRGRVVTLPTDEHGLRPHAVTELDDGCEAVPVHAVELFRACLPPSPEIGQRAPVAVAHADCRARLFVIKLEVDVAAEALEAVDLAPRHLPGAEVLFEFGNGDKLIFDIGTGSMRNINALMIPAEYLTKIFISHLHTDHWGDRSSLWAGGWTSGRPVPLEVWGPSGQTPEMGIAYAIDHFLKAFNWDYQTRAFKITPVPGKITVHEFDYKAVNEVVYDQNGIKVRSIPAIHAGDGPVSFIIEYAGMKLVFGGDSSPNKWFVEHAKDADFVIHEAFAPPQSFVEYGQPPQLAWRACCEFHTSGPAFGKIMSTIKPRHAVSYHSFVESFPELRAGIRETYDGPLSIAEDMMVWNITRDKVTERMAVSTDRASGVPGPTQQPPPDKSYADPMSDFIKQGEWGPGFNAQNKMLDEHSEKYGLEDQDWRPAKPWYKPNK